MATGAEILAAGSTWVDADNGLVTVDVVAPALRTGWGIIFSGNRAAVTNQAGPGGELGIRLTENGTTAQGIWGPTSAITNLGPGPIKITTLCRMFDNATQRLPGGTYDASNPLSAQRWRFPDLFANGTGFGAYLRCIEPAKYAAEPVLGEPSVAYAFTGLEKYDSYTRTDRVDGWSEIEWEAYIGNKASLVGIGQSIRASASNGAGNSQVVLDIAALTIEQKRVSEWRDRRTNAIIYSQSTNNSRLCKLGDFWLGSRPCVTEGVSSATGNVSITAAATPAVLMAMICPRLSFPDADSQVLAIGDTKLIADTDGTWHLVQGATDISTAYPIAVVPVCVALRDNGSTIDLFIDGTLIKNAAINLTTTGHAIAGGHAAIAIQSVWTSTTTLNDTDMAAAMLELRRLAGLPPYLPVWIETGQSNENHSLPMQSSAGTGAKRRAGWGFFLEGTTAIAQAQNTGASASYYYGPSTGAFDGAQVDGQLGVIYHYNLGGQPISHWLNGATGQTTIAAGVASLLASIGTPLARVERFFFIQGEADASFSTPEATYLAGLENIRSWLTASYGSFVRWYGLRLTSVYPTGTPAAVRSAQDAFVAAHPSQVAYATVDPVWVGVDNVHYTERGKRVIGRAVYDADLAPAAPVALEGLNQASAPISPMPSGLSGTNTTSAPISPMPAPLEGANEASAPISPMPQWLEGANEASFGPRPYRPAPSERTTDAPAAQPRLVVAPATGGRAARIIP